MTNKGDDFWERFTIGQNIRLWQHSNTHLESINRILLVLFDERRPLFFFLCVYLLLPSNYFGNEGKIFCGFSTKY